MKKRALSLVKSNSELTAVQLHTLSKEATIAAARREADALENALRAIGEAETIGLAVYQTAESGVARLEVHAARIALAGACQHLRAAVVALEKS